MSIQGVKLQPVARECPHIKGMVSIDENLLVIDLEEEDLEVLLSYGFRHFGEYFFRPVCNYCRSCISVRIPVQQFKPSPSVRRLLNRNKHFSVTLEKPSPSREMFEIYNRHKERFESSPSDNYEEFVKSFFHPFFFSRMLCIRDKDRLVAVSHVDVTTRAMSAVYCYFDDQYARFSPGKFAVFKEIQLAAEMGLQWLYLGYYIPPNRHTHYKLQFKPNQVMTFDCKWFDHMDAAGNIINPLPPTASDHSKKVDQRLES